MKTYTVNNIDELQKEFYQMYDPDYWLYRIMLLKNSHDNFDSLKNTLVKNTEDFIDEDFKRVIRTELHFLYFQMIETLFEIIFAIYENDNRDLWVSLTFSDYRENYKRIADLNDYSDLFTQKRKDGQEKEISMLQWIFYFDFNPEFNNDDWNKTLTNIKKLLLIFARDFTDRGEYNAYKHSLRFYNSPFSMAIGITGGNYMQSLGSSKDCITFLEEHKKKNKDGKIMPTGEIVRTQKPFDFERDYSLCVTMYSMIKSIIHTRKYRLLPGKDGEKIYFRDFRNIDDIKTYYSGGVTKSSFTV
jgi:hypothetical protein